MKNKLTKQAVLFQNPFVANV